MLGRKGGFQWRGIKCNFEKEPRYDDDEDDDDDGGGGGTYKFQGGHGERRPAHAHHSVGQKVRSSPSIRVFQMPLNLSLPRFCMLS